MTHVWKAVEISEFGGSVLSSVQVALKDVWLDEDAMTECSIQDKIFDAVDTERAKHTNGQKSCLDHIASLPKIIDGDPLNIVVHGHYREYFMHISCDGKGQRLKDRPTGATPVQGLFSSGEGKGISSRSHQVPKVDQSRNTGTPVHPLRCISHTDVTPQIYQSQRYRAKEHYFLVYSDVCTALHNAPNLPTSFKVLVDAWMGM